MRSGKGLSLEREPDFICVVILRGVYIEQSLQQPTGATVTPSTAYNRADNRADSCLV